ncbi:ParA family protein [Photobacterium damselae]|uniref:ParA family protein n=1 Tax=Photobacterium damselae TaxID=38293 RepID=UPI001F284DC6|nr:ParA family protein [Photobacterium damselae]UKA04669.1 ParA family protein [Photobacterium damselae subsp. damselae]
MLAHEEIAQRLNLDPSVVFDVMNVCQTASNIMHLSREARKAIQQGLLVEINRAGHKLPKFLLDIAKFQQLSIELKDGEDAMQSAVAARIGEDDKQVHSSLWRRFLYDYAAILESEELEENFSSYTSHVRPIYIYDRSLRKRVYGHDHSTLSQLTSELVDEFSKKCINKNASMEEILELKKEFCSRLGLKTEDAVSKCIVISAKKGGVGKSAMTTGLAGALALTASRPYKVLIIDVDNQGSTSHLVAKRDRSGRKMFTESPSIFDVLRASKNIDGRDGKTVEHYNETLRNALSETAIPNVHILAAKDDPFDSQYSLGLRNSEREIRPSELRHVVDDAMKVGGYDFVIIDSRPDLHTSSKLALAAADMVINVMRPSGEDREAFCGYLLEVAVDVIPEIFGGESWRMPPMKIIFNQVNKKISQQRVNIDIINTALISSGSFASSFNSLILENQVISSSSSIDYSIWSVPREYVSSVSAKNLGAFRAQFTNIALEIEDEALSERKHQA